MAAAAIAVTRPGASLRALEDDAKAIRARLLRIPEVGEAKLLGEQPELARAAVEEVMRVRPTVTWVTREALEDFTAAARARPVARRHSTTPRSWRRARPDRSGPG